MRSKKYPKISVIIPVKPGDKAEAAIDALKNVDYPPEMIEVFLVCGFSPSRQRNEAAKMVGGEILYFLDNDAELEPKAIKGVARVFSGKTIYQSSLPQGRGFSFFPSGIANLIIERFFSGIIYKGEIGAVGGPNVWWQKESFWASITGAILESFFAHSKMAARYRPIGTVHRVDEKQLILCNLAVRSDVFRKVGGFNEALYPNEENELLNRIENAGYQLIYHPGILVFRPRRETFQKLLSAFFHYGRGRMEQIRIEGVWESLPILAPLVFLFYLFGLFIYHPWFAFLPALLYFGMGFGSALGCASRRKKPYLAIFLPPFFLLAHLSYAFGLLWGLKTDLLMKKRQGIKQKITVKKLKSLGQTWKSLT